MSDKHDQNMGCGCLVFIIIIGLVFRFLGVVPGIVVIVISLIIIGVIQMAHEKKQKVADKVITDKFEDALEAMNALENESRDN
ncbi:MAG: hypothetical protein KOO69_00430 [Victivallales bacterium]|nr:hypothetical protein [Victivallales bacterium]